MAALIRNLRSIDEFQEVLERSLERPVMLFKHSTRCGTSSFALAEFQDYAREAAPRGVECAQVLVVEDRPVSSFIAEQLGVRHASPQVILIRDGRAVWSESHGGVTEAALVEAEGS